MIFRPNTWDENIWISVYEKNEYQLPEQLDPETIVFDVGMHIGSFSKACLDRGAGKVIGFEPFKDNFDIAVANLQGYPGRMFFDNRAVWRSDDVPAELYYAKGSNESNTGSGTVVNTSTDRRVGSVKLDELIKNEPYVTLLKLDCEGSEWSILFTSKELSRVDQIIGEYHEYNTENNPSFITPMAKVGERERYGEAELVEFLESQGYDVRTWRNPKEPRLGLFWAKR